MITLATLYQNKQTLIALACINQRQTTKSAQRQVQKTAVRHLLSHCMAGRFDGYQLNQTCYPYQITQKNKSSFFVSFSHSGNSVALIISPTPCGIDIETNPVGYHIAKRFFHQNELRYIAGLANSEKDKATTLLWQIKECMVKLQNTTLSQLISQDMSEYAKALMDNSRQWVKYQSINGEGYLLWQDHQMVAIQHTNT